MRAMSFLVFFFMLMAGIVSAATTIGTNIFTEGILAVTGTSTLMGNVGIGTTTPYVRLSVAGEVAASHYTATSTTATSTFAGDLSVSGTVSSSYLISNSLSGVNGQGRSADVIIPTGTATLIGTMQGLSGRTVNLPLSESGLYTGNNSTGFQSGSSATQSDAIYIGASRYWYSSLPCFTGWRDVSYNDASNVSITPTDSLFMKRIGAPFTWTIPPATIAGGDVILSGGVGVAGGARGNVIVFNGNVGIGTTSPTNKLEIFHTSNNGIKITRSVNTLYSTLNFLDAINEKWAIGQIPNSNSLVFRRGASSNDMVIDTSGNVGIGTTTPATRLHISSGASATTTVSIGELGLTTSKGCVNMNQADGSAGSFYLSGGTLKVENNYCR